jgi:hypothetical protein
VTKILQRGGYYGRYLPSGHLVYVHEGVIFVVGSMRTGWRSTARPRRSWRM